jgi:hypothetical protein
VLPILNPGKDPKQPSSYRPISLFDTVGKPFEKMVLTSVLREVNERGLLRDEQLARLVERVNRNFDDSRLTGAVSLDVAKAFDTVWIKGLLYKLTVINFQSYVVKCISSFHDCCSLRKSFKTATSTTRVMRAGVAQGGLVTLYSSACM